MKQRSEVNSKPRLISLIGGLLIVAFVVFSPLVWFNYNYLSTQSELENGLIPQNKPTDKYKGKLNPQRIPYSLINYISSDNAVTEQRPKFFPSKEYQSPNLRVIVMTYKRENSLLRLLKSLEKSYYFGARIDLDIFVDKPVEHDTYTNVVDTAESFEWKHGVKTVHVRTKNAGLRHQWIHTWNESIVLASQGRASLTPDTKELVLILEDDIEVSSFYYTWLKFMHMKYENSGNVAGFSLQRANLCVNNCPFLQGGPIDSGSMKYNLVGSWGYSPTARHWCNFIDFVNNFDEIKYPPFILDLKPTQWYKRYIDSGRCPGPNCMWTILHLKYTATHVDRFTIYAKAAKAKTLGANHQEAGMHYSVKTKKDFEILRTYDKTLFHEFAADFTNSIPDLLQIDWNGKILSSTNSMLQEVQFISNQHGYAIIQFLNAAFVPMTQHWICNTRHLDDTTAPDSLDEPQLILPRTLFITTEALAYEQLMEFASSEGIKLNIILHEMEKAKPDELSYGEVQYYKYINWRAHQLNILLQNDIPFLLVEADSVWLKNPLDSIIDPDFEFTGYQDDPTLEKKIMTDLDNFDLVLFDDNFPEKVPQGGFIFFNPTVETKLLFRELLRRMDIVQKKLKKRRDKFNAKESGNEQYILTELVKKQKNLRLRWLDEVAFSSGKWYDSVYLQEPDTNQVILFNWVVGISAKISRAQENRHWYLDSHGQCKTP